MTSGHGGATALRLLGNVRPLDEKQYVYDAMLAGWSDQQSSRGLVASTIQGRILTVHRFEAFTGRYPWEWSVGDIEDYTTHAKSGARPAARSTIRAFQMIIRLFCEYLCDGRYEWAAECERRFGQVPQQICHEWNTTAHLVDYEGRAQRRALTYDELEQFFTAADARVESILDQGRKGALAALRDAQIFKTIYAYGLRRAEAVGLDVADLRPNGAAPRFGRFGAVEVRWGKGSRGSGPRRRSVLTVPELGWVTAGLAQWVDHARPRFTDEAGTLWPTERGSRVSLRYIDMRFAALRDQLGLPPELSVHALRHTYVTNLIEWGYSEKFVQDQVGHAYASTTAIYTSLGDDYKTRMVTRALARIYGENDADNR